MNYFEYLSVVIVGLDLSHYVAVQIMQKLLCDDQRLLPFYLGKIPFKDLVGPRKDTLFDYQTKREIKSRMLIHTMPQ
jgi:hypothetical protein